MRDAINWLSERFVFFLAGSVVDQEHDLLFVSQVDRFPLDLYADARIYSFLQLVQSELVDQGCLSDS